MKKFLRGDFVKSSNQKLKLLYLMKILLEKTDEENAISVSGMIEELARYGVSAERMLKVVVFPEQ